MRRSWNKGFTKETHPSVRKTSETMRARKIDNFATWREKMRICGSMPTEYPAFPHTAKFAELIGVILGDGHIEKHPRTERLVISANSKNLGFIERYCKIMEELFHKKSHRIPSKLSDCTRLTLYEKKISSRLGISTGNRKKCTYPIPKWIARDKDSLIAYLRGLYEAEGSFCVHVPTCTYKFLFSNRNESLLQNVYTCVKKLGFHPHRSKYQIQVSRKAEVYKIKKMIRFRQY